MIKKYKLLLIIFCMLYLYSGKAYCGSALTESATGYSGNHSDLMNSPKGLRLSNKWVLRNPSLSPEPRQWLSLWCGQNGMYLFGGQEEVLRKNDTYIYDGDWIEVNTSSQPYNRASMAVADNYLFGGVDVALNYYSDLWFWDEASEDWSIISYSTFPAGRYGHAFNASSNKILLYGGKSASGYESDSWILDTATEEFSELNLSTYPAARIAVQTCSISNSKSFLFGGLGSSYYNDSWIFDFTASSWSVLSTDHSPSARSGAVLSYDPRNDVVVLYGGRKATSYYNDTWLYNIQTQNWYQQSPEIEGGALQASAEGGMEFCTRDEEMILFGGVDSSDNFLGETWAYILRSSGVYVSPVFDLGSADTGLEYNSFEWSASTPADAQIKFQIASSNISPPSDFRGLGAYTTSYYSNSMSNIDPYHDNKRYLRYRVYMERSLLGSTTDFYISTVTINYNHYPSKPVHAGPPYSSAADGGVANTPVSFYWYNSTDQDGDTLTYSIELATSTDFAYIVESSSNIPEIALRSLKQLYPDHGGPYYWRVRSYDGLNYGQYSDYWEIYVDTEAPAALTVLSAERSADTNGAVKLDWIAPDSGWSYRIRWKESSSILTEGAWNSADGSVDYAPGSIIQNSPESYLLTGLAAATTYWFSVRLRDEAGNYSDFSPSPSARTNSPPNLWGFNDLVTSSWGNNLSSTSTIPFMFNINDPDPEDTVKVDINLARTQISDYDVAIVTGISVSPYNWDSNNVTNSSLYWIRLTAYDQRGLSTSFSTGPVTISNQNQAPWVNIISPSGSEVWSGIQSANWEYGDINSEDQLFCEFYISSDGGLSFSTVDPRVQDADLPYSFGTGNYQDSNQAMIKVIVYDDKGGSTERLSNLFTLTNSNIAPQNFDLISPASSSFIYDVNMNFEWEASSDLDSPSFSYTLLYSTSPDFSNPTSVSALSDPSYSAVLQDETWYYWYVTAIDDELVEKKSNSEFMFAVDEDPIRVVSLEPDHESWVLLASTDIVRIQFNKTPDPMLPLHLSLALEDNYGSKLAYAYSLDTTTALMNLRPNPNNEFQPSRIYTLNFASSFKDKIGHPITGRSEFSFVNLISTSMATDLELEDIASLNIAAGTLSETGLFVLEEAQANQSAAADLASRLNASIGTDNIELLEIKAYNADKELIAGFNKPLRCNVYYEDNNAGFVGDSGIDENYLRIFKLENSISANAFSGSGTGAQAWQVQGGDVDIAANKVSLQLSFPGIYALKAYARPNADISGLLVYPNPFNPYLNQLSIKFLLIESMDLDLEIYTLTGDLVYRVSGDMEGSTWGELNEFVWDGRNGAGSMVANGMYYARLVKGKKEKKNFLIGVVK